MKNTHLPKTAGVIVGVIIVLIGVGLVLKGKFFSKAANGMPQDVVISAISQNSAKVTWSTGDQTQAVIEYGVSPTAMNFFAPEASASLQHSVDLTLLSPSTTYYFRMRIGDKVYDNAGVPWTFTTKGKDAAGANVTPLPVTTGTNAEPPITQAQTVSTVPLPPVTISTSPVPSGPASTCTETDCAAIKQKFGQGCDTQDYVRCMMKSTK